MLSILIPIYNHSVAALCEALLCLAENMDFPVEIVCMEDGSTEHLAENSLYFRKHPEIQYIIGETNAGRSKIRNKLARRARYEWLLFLDCDSLIISPDFLKNYKDAITANDDTVYCGGSTYTSDPDKECYLHWFCGVYKEAIQVGKTRNKFYSNNFLISRKVLLEIGFDERLTEYGHEDTLLRIMLNRRGYGIRLIDNPVLHNGLSGTSEFLEKSKRAICNLLFLRELLTETEVSEIPILRYFNRIEQFRLTIPLAQFFNFVQPLIHWQLHTKKPSLYLFDLYKLGYMAKLRFVSRRQRHRNDLSQDT